MKISAYSSANSVNNYNKYSPNNSSTINKVNQSSISFGHYLDDLLSEKEEMLESTQNSIRMRGYYYTVEKRENSEKIEELDKNIQYNKKNNNSLISKMNDLLKTKEQKNLEINKLQEKKQNLQTKINKTDAENRNLENEVKNISLKIEEDKINADNVRKEKIQVATIETNQKFKNEVNQILSNAKTTIAQRVIDPTKYEKDARSVDVPSGVLIESSSSDESKKMFEWIVKKSDSNFAIINAAEFKNKMDLYKAITNIAKKSQKEFEKNNRRTFTFIDNFEYCATTNNDNKGFVGALKIFLDTCSVDYHNTLVASTPDVSKLDPIVSGVHRFQVSVKLDKQFMQDNDFGYNTVLKEIPRFKITGKEIKDISFNSMIKRTFGKIKRLFLS